MSGPQSVPIFSHEIIAHIASTPYGLARWFLAGVFAASSIPKLRRPSLAAMAIVDFRVSRRVRPGWGMTLGAFEAILATSLAARIALGLAMTASALLLWLFAALIARSLLTGQRFACFCFGETDSELSTWSLLRTTGLAVVASIMVPAAVRAQPGAGFAQRDVVQAIGGLSLLAIVTLVSRVPRLLKWNALRGVAT